MEVGIYVIQQKFLKLDDILIGWSVSKLESVLLILHVEEKNSAFSSEGHVGYVVVP